MTLIIGVSVVVMVVAVGNTLLARDKMEGLSLLPLGFCCCCCCFCCCCFDLVGDFFTFVFVPAVVVGVGVFVLATVFALVEVEEGGEGVLFSADFEVEEEEEEEESCFSDLFLENYRMHKLDLL